jgi:undecaprenyl phosphate N,N'-diacetylbacillosamine 1-phosphate transferase
MYKLFLKPFLDWIIAFCALIVLIPFFILIAVLIQIDSKGPAFFFQERLGRYGKVFKVIKFRSMYFDRAPTGSHKLYENDPRITKVGSFIRKTSIDELPQILNILKGEMSFIGPRPPVINFPKKYEDYSESERPRFLVKPGISGLAQIRCREVHDWDINIPIDAEYVQNYSFIYDLKLFLASLTSFFRSDNIYRRE